MNVMRVGLIGCGNVSSNYLRYVQQFPILEVVACADLVLENAQAIAAEFDVPRACTVDDLLADKSIELVINLTVPRAHAQVALAAIESGKHVYGEKPLGINCDEGKSIIESAKAKDVRVGNAPDTFFGAGHQTARKLIDDGAIGRPLAATCFMLSRGAEGWHPNAEFFFKVGAGPMLDFGPYYLTDLLQLLGPMKQVTGSAAIAIPERILTGPSNKSRKITVETPDHVSGTVEFKNGAIATIIMSFATRFGDFWPITIFGTDGTLRVPDPNGFDGDVFLRRVNDEDWQKVEFHHRTGFGRSVGVADMAHSIRSGRPHRASGEQAYAVLEAMQGILDSARTGKAVALSADYERCAPLPTDLGDELVIKEEPAECQAEDAGYQMLDAG